MDRDIADQQSYILKEELSARCSRNHQYSQRAFAKFLGISHTYLGMVMNKKRVFSYSLAEEISEKLSLTSEKKSLFTGCTISPQQTTDQHKEIDTDIFDHLSEWYNYAILSLIKVPHFSINAKSLSCRLGLSEATAKSSIERLERLGLIKKTENGYSRGKPIKFENQRSTSATRRFQKQLLEKAINSIEDYDFNEREVSSMTLAMSANLIPYARKRIKEFRREIAEELESMSSPNEVYNLTVQICPVSKKEYLDDI